MNRWFGKAWTRLNNKDSNNEEIADVTGFVRGDIWVCTKRAASRRPRRLSRTIVVRCTDVIQQKNIVWPKIYLYSNGVREGSSKRLHNKKGRAKFPSEGSIYQALRT